MALQLVRLLLLAGPTIALASTHSRHIRLTVDQTSIARKKETLESKEVKPDQIAELRFLIVQKGLTVAAVDDDQRERLEAALKEVLAKAAVEQTKFSLELLDHPAAGGSDKDGDHQEPVDKSSVGLSDKEGDQQEGIVVVVKLEFGKNAHPDLSDISSDAVLKAVKQVLKDASIAPSGSTALAVPVALLLASMAAVATAAGEVW